MRRAPGRCAPRWTMISTREGRCAPFRPSEALTFCRRTCCRRSRRSRRSRSTYSARRSRRSRLRSATSARLSRTRLSSSATLRRTCCAARQPRPGVLWITPSGSRGTPAWAARPWHWVARLPVRDPRSTGRTACRRLCSRRTPPSRNTRIAPAATFKVVGDIAYKLALGTNSLLGGRSPNPMLESTALARPPVAYGKRTKLPKLEWQPPAPQTGSIDPLSVVEWSTASAAPSKLEFALGPPVLRPSEPEANWLAQAPNLSLSPSKYRDLAQPVHFS